MYRRTARRRSAALTAIGAACLFAGTFALPSWNHALLSSGFYKYARHIDPQDLAITLRAGRLEYYKEGPAGTVSVKLLGGTRSLAIDGKVDASDGADMLTQRLLGLLPTVLHPNPQDALVIGLGSGVTAHAVRAAGAIRRLDIVEISPQVVEASALFEQQNGGVLNAPGVRLLIGDGRSHLQLTPKLYDVIVSEPSNPWMAGVAALFTREFFEAVRRRLSADGVFCQWAHTYEIDIGDLRSIVRTFGSVFPHGTLWLVGDGDLLLIGTHGPQLERQIAGIGERLQRGTAVRLLSDSGVASSSGPFFLLSLYAGGPRELAGFGESAPIQTDDRMKLEFTAARAMYAPPEGNAPALRKLAAGAVPPAAVSETLRAATASDWIARGEAGLKAEAFQMAHESFRRAATLDSRNYEAPRGAVTAAVGAGRMPEETRWLRDRADTAPQNAAARTALSYVLAMTGDIDGAIGAAVEATTIDSDSPQPLEQLASVLADAGDPRLASVAATLIRKFPARDDSRYYRAAALFFQNRHDEAEGAVTALVDANPRHARAHNLRGIIRAAKGDHEGAIAAFRASLDADPRDMTVYVNLGNAYLERGDADMASRVFSEAVALDPRSDAARDALQRIAR
jgi:spermidine synthase